MITNSFKWYSQFGSKNISSTSVHRTFTPLVLKMATLFQKGSQLSTLTQTTSIINEWLMTYGLPNAFTQFIHIPSFENWVIVAMLASSASNIVIRARGAECSLFFIKWTFSSQCFTVVVDSGARLICRSERGGAMRRRETCLHGLPKTILKIVTLTQGSYSEILDWIVPISCSRRYATNTTSTKSLVSQMSLVPVSLSDHKFPLLSTLNFSL